MIRTEEKNVKRLESIYEFLAGFSITIPTFPVNESTGMATISLPDPEFMGLFLDNATFHRAPLQSLDPQA